MKSISSNRYQAFGVHLLISIPIVVCFAYLFITNWYPEPIFSVDGGWPIYHLTVVIFLIAGPVLTLIVYKAGKKGMKFDLVAIAILQLTAISYAGMTLYQDRPIFLVFSTDRFVLVSADDIDSIKLGYLSLPDNDSSGPAMVFAKMPENPEELNKFNIEVMQGKPDLEYRVEYYESYVDNLTTVLAKGKDADYFKAISTVYKEKVDSFNKLNCQDGCVYYPLVGKKHDALLAISKKTGRFLGGINIDPWVKKRPI